MLRTVKVIRSIQILLIFIGIFVEAGSNSIEPGIGLITFGVGILGLVSQIILKQIKSVQLKKQVAEERRNNIYVRETYKDIENYRTDTNEMLDPYLMYKYMYPQTRKRRRKKYEDQQIEKYAAWANMMSNMKDEPDNSKYKLTYEDMYGDSKNKVDTEDNQYSDREYFAEAVERVKSYNREQNRQNNVDIQTVNVTYGNGKAVKSGLYSVSMKKQTEQQTEISKLIDNDEQLEF